MGWYGRGSSSLKSSIFRTSRPEGQKREVFSNDELVHVWASGNVARGRSSNMFFENGIIFSFGHHYEAAKIHGDFVLLNSDGYSPTTRKHLYNIQGAVSHKTVIEVPVVDPTEREHHEANLEYLEGELFTAVQGILSQVGWHGGPNGVELMMDTINKYRRLFALGDMLVVDREDAFFTDIEQAYETKCKKNQAQQEKREARIKGVVDEAQRALDTMMRSHVLSFLADELTQDQFRHARRGRVVVGKAFGNDRHEYLTGAIPSDLLEAYDAKMRQVHGESIEAWRAGETNHLDYSARGDYAILRVKGNDVQTSQGASVPLSHALRLLGMIEARTARKGERVGHYTLETVSSLSDVPPVITIGCHKILLSEAQTVLAPYREVTK